MIVVSNSSPLVSLAAIGRLELLHDLYDTITIPQAVHQEVVIRGLGRPGAAEVQSLDWIVCQDVSDLNMVTALEGRLDRGEAEAITLAVELQADLLLMDERLGRAEASRFGLRFVGVLGVLIEAKARGLLQRIEPILDELQNDAGFRMSEALRARVLQAAGE
jgi:predicted nucleic acid-binding protein